MALLPPVYAGLILANSGLVGAQAPQMAFGIANGFTAYLLSLPPGVIVSVDAGAPGAGAGVGVLNPATCLPPVLQGLLEANLRGLGLIGPQLSQLTLGLSIATCTYLASAQTVTVHSSVGIGAGVGKFAAIEPAGLAASITATTGFVGIQWPQLVLGISNGLVAFLLSNPVFVITIAGAAGPGAAAGVGVGKII